MNKSYKLTTNDYMKFTQYATKRITQSKGSKLTEAIKNIILWLVIAMFFMGIFRILGFSSFTIHWATASMVLVPFILLFLLAFFNQSKIRKKTIPKENGIMIGEKEVEFKKDGILETHSLGFNFYKWGAIECIEENQGDLYIFFESVLALIIPSTAFSTCDEKEEIKQFVLTHV